MANTLSLLVFLLWSVVSMHASVCAQDTHQTVPSATSSTFNSTLQNYLRVEPANRTAEATAQQGWVVANCLAASSGSKVLDAFACTAYTANGHYAVQASTALDLGASPGPACANDDIALVVMAEGITSPGGNFVQSGSSQYWVDCTTPALPAPPTTVPLFFAFIASSVTTVVDVRPLAPTLPGRRNAHGEQTIPAEYARWAGDALAPYVTSGCLPTIPGASLTLAAFACSGYAQTSTGALLHIQQDSHAVTLSGGNGVYWLLLYADLTTTLGGGWTREFGTQYLWQLAASKPAAVAGGLLLAQVTVAGGVITAVSLEAPRRITRDMTISASMTTSANSPWTWANGTSVLTVAVGQTLTFGACPQAGRWRIFDADGASTGLVRFRPGACDAAYPEWWGVDPTGVIDSTTLWNVAMAASAGQTVLRCTGLYAISATTPNAALNLLNHTQIVGGPWWQSAHDGGRRACDFAFTGTGTALRAADIGISHENMRFEGITIRDVASTGAYGIDMHKSTLTLGEMVHIIGFNVGMRLESFVYYGHWRQLKLFNARTMCLEIAGPVNYQEIEAFCGSTATTMTYGIAVGFTGTYATSLGPRFRFLVETASGVAMSIQRVQGLQLEAYVEHPGLDANFTAQTSIQLGRIRGGHVHAAVLGTTLDAGKLTQGIVCLDSSGGGSNDDIAGCRNVTFTGIATQYQTTGLRIDSGTGGWGNDVSRFATDGASFLSLGSFTTGTLLGRNYFTHGALPALDEGRGCTKTACVDSWQVGDRIRIVTGLSVTNATYVVTTAGNPPTTFAAIIEDAGFLALDTASATPSVLVGSTYHTRLITVGSGTAITNLTGGIDGMTVSLLALGTRTLTNGATMELVGGVNLTLDINDTVVLQLRSGVWYQLGTSNN
jgi:hypothetical protein